MSDIYICPICDSKCPMCDDEYQCFECEKLEKEKNMNKPKFKQGDKAKLTEELKDKLRLISHKYQNAETVEIKREPKLNYRTNQFVYWCDCIECRSTIPISEDELEELI